MPAGSQSADEWTAAIQARYPSRRRLPSGREVALRLMEESDREGILTFAWGLSPDDLLDLRWDITHDQVVNDWLQNIASGRSITVLAREGGVVVGEASVTSSETDWTRHIGDVHLSVSPPVRREGLGRLLAQEIFAIAALRGLKRLSAQLAHDQAEAQAVFREFGFEPVALLPGFVVGRDGRKRDLLVMACDVEGRESADA